MFSRITRLIACTALYLWSADYLLLPILINLVEEPSRLLSIFRRGGFEKAYSDLMVQSSLIIKYIIGPIFIMFLLYTHSDTVTLYKKTRKHHVACITISTIGLILYSIHGINVLTSPFTLSALVVIIGFIITDHTDYGRKFKQQKVDSVD